MNHVQCSGLQGHLLTHNNDIFIMEYTVLK